MTAIVIFFLLGLCCLLLSTDRAHRQRWRRADNARLDGARLDGTSGELGPEASRRLTAGISDVPLLLELLAAASEAGMALPGAMGLIADVADTRIRRALRGVVAGLEMGASWEHSWAAAPNVRAVNQLREALSFSALTGAAAAPLLYAEAAQIRRMAKRAAEAKAASLGVKLVIPLGLCSLPAFVCLGIVPVVIAMIPAL